MAATNKICRPTILTEPEHIAPIAQVSIDGDDQTGGVAIKINGVRVASFRSDGCLHIDELRRKYDYLQLSASQTRIRVKNPKGTVMSEFHQD